LSTAAQKLGNLEVKVWKFLVQFFGNFHEQNLATSNTKSWRFYEREIRSFYKSMLRVFRPGNFGDFWENFDTKTNNSRFEKWNQQRLRNPGSLKQIFTKFQDFAINFYKIPGLRSKF
jgi:hypothetical protein